jgi:predicted transcriptional regulator
MTDEKPPLRDKDQTVLHHIQEGRDDIQKITEATTLENHEVNYCFQKLEKLGLIEVKKPDGRVERVIDGQKRVFEAPKEAVLIKKGEHYLEHSEQKDLDEYENLSHRELVKKVHELENELEHLERSFSIFQTQVKTGLDSS